MSYNKTYHFYSLNTTKAFRVLPYETAATYGGSNFRRNNGRWQMESQPYHYKQRKWNSPENIVRNILTIIGDPSQTILPSRMNSDGKISPPKGEKIDINIIYFK